MKKRLCDISIADFVELMEGNYGSLLDKGEKVDDRELLSVVSDIVTEYKEITDPAGMKSSIIERDEYKKLEARIVLLNVCRTLVLLMAYNEVRTVLESIGEGMPDDDDKLAPKIETLLRRSLFEKKRLDDLRDAEEIRPERDVRRSFDAEFAFIMRLFKMQIDIRTMPASIYANLVRQAIEEQKNFHIKIDA